MVESAGAGRTTIAAYEVRTTRRRSVIPLLKAVGTTVGGAAFVAGVMRLRPSLFYSRDRPSSPWRDVNTFSLVLYVSAAIFALLTVAGVVAISVGLLRGVIMATCPGCRADLVVGGELETKCTRCGALLKVVGVEP